MNAPGGHTGWWLSIDFGNSNTTAAFRRGGQPVETLRLSSQSDQMPSAVFIGDNGILAGEAALHEARLRPANFEPTPKRRLDDEFILVDGNYHTGVELAAAVLAAVRERAVYMVSSVEPPSQVILTHPEEWTGHRQQLLVRAAQTAGYDPTTIALVSEPRAAAWYYGAKLTDNVIGDGAKLAVFDFGGGTCDIAVLEAVDRDGVRDYRILASDGRDHLGGNDLDVLLEEWTFAELVKGGAGTMVEALQQPVNLGARRTLRESLREAKHHLSGAPRANIPIAVAGNSASLSISQLEFERLIDTEIRSAATLATNVLTRAGLAPGQLDRLYLTGGSSQIPLVWRTLESVIGLTPSTLGDPKLVVCQGALMPPVMSSVASSTAGVGRHGSGPIGPIRGDNPAPVSGSEHVPPPREHSGRRRRLTRVLLGAGVLAVLIAISAFAWAQLRPDPPPPPPPPAPEDCDGLTGAECDLFRIAPTSIQQNYTCDNVDPWTGDETIRLQCTTTLEEEPATIWLVSCTEDGLAEKVFDREARRTDVQPAVDSMNWTDVDGDIRGKLSWGTFTAGDKSTWGYVAWTYSAERLYVEANDPDMSPETLSTWWRYNSVLAHE
ncbi:Hsp70 family protein [Rhodococcus aetherivorans]|uniref:Hsp70 family protein n=1 Tax=Rhodococcus aetherivorans TaxID=191292 RepID=UPI00366DD40D